jgi:ABC-type branched-subunit amino acid transport system substrate-binding protein
LGILNNPKYALVGTADWPSNMGTFPSIVKQQLIGSFALATQVPTNSLYQPLVNRFQSMYPGLQFTNTSQTVPTDVNWYDIVWYYAQAIANILTRTGKGSVAGSDLLTEIHNMSFSGATGPFNFDVNYDRIQTFDLVNFQDGTGVFTKLAWFNTPKYALVQPYEYRVIMAIT